jgi:hypothetical protein
VERRVEALLMVLPGLWLLALQRLARLFLARRSPL